MNVIADTLDHPDEAISTQVPLLARLQDWVVTVDHKRLGIMYISMGLVFLLVAGLQACHAQLFRPTASSGRSTPWNRPAPTLAQGAGAPDVRAGPVPPTQHNTSRTLVEPVDQGGSGGETKSMGA